jgi:hypothetical protein
MNLRRARAQDWLMGVFGVLVVASLFLGWYRACPPSDCATGTTVSAWEAFAVIDVLLLVAGIVAVVALVLTVLHRTPAVPLALTSAGTFVAVAAAICMLVRLAFAPALPGAGQDTETVRLLGAWLGTGAALGLLAAMLASIRDERTPAPPRSVEEQARSVRTLSLSSSAGGADAGTGSAT